MKPFDYNYVSRKTINAFKRFPVAILLIALLTFSGIYMIFKPYESDIWQHLFLTSIIGIPLFVSINLFLERMEIKRWFNFTLNIIGFAFLLLFFFNLPPHQIYDKHYSRALLLLCAFISSIFYLPFIGFERQMPFWYYNKSLIKRVLLSALYALVFFVGIGIALWAIDTLFNINIKSEWYQMLAVLSFWLFLPWFFLAGISRNFSYHSQKEYYPKELRLFTLYALVPINFIYALILLGYTIKIAISGIWPSGWTVGLITGYTVLEFVILIFLYPVLFEKENKKLIKFIHLNFYITIVFLIIYFLALFQRIAQYGLTENRLYTLLWGILVLFWVIYFIINKIKDIRILPFMLMLVAFLSVSGPWNVFRIAKHSQTHRLEKILQQHQLLQNGKIATTGKDIPLKTQADISSIVSYLVSTHGPNTIKTYFPASTDSLFDTLENKMYKTDIFQQLFSSVGLIYVPYFREEENVYQNCSFYTESKKMFYFVKNSDYAVTLDIYPYSDSLYHQIIKLNDSLTIYIDINHQNNILTLTVNQIQDASINIKNLYDTFSHLPKIRSDAYASYFDPEILTINMKGLKYDYDIYIDRLEFQITDKKTKLTGLSGVMLLKKN